jgi:ABC-type Mn2+/Zn2+ transport system ATPase subunit
MDILEAQASAGRTVIATTHDLMCVAQRFQEVVAINRTVIAHGPASLVLDADFLARTYGGHLLIIDGRTIALDDAHHHDESRAGERHFHDESRR